VGTRSNYGEDYEQHDKAQTIGRLIDSAINSPALLVLAPQEKLLQQVIGVFMHGAFKALSGGKIL
jgi:hypothetical protein